MGSVLAETREFVARAKEVVAAAKASGTYRTPRLGRRVLVVEDDKGLLDLYRDWLGRAGYEPVIVEDLLEASQALAREPMSYCAALVDWRMPLGSGGWGDSRFVLELLSAARVETALVTGYTHLDEVRDTARKLKSVTLIGKPTDRAAIVGFLRKHAPLEKEIQ